MSWRSTIIPALALLAAAACGSDNPAGPTDRLTPAFDLVPPPAGPNPLGEEIVVCKVGGIGPIDFSYTGDVSGGFTIDPGQCWRVGFFGGDGVDIDITETVPDDQVLDSIVVDQLNLPDQLVTGSNTVTGVIAAGQPFPQSAVVTFYNTAVPPPPGDEGCTPGYWKNHTDAWEGYAPGDLAGDVFDLGAFPSLASQTLLQSLGGGGGPGTTGAAKILVRAAVAALLNAENSGVAYTWDAADIISDVNDALNSDDRAAMLDLAGELDSDNNLGCPLN